jgi:hypothetical protein
MSFTSQKVPAKMEQMELRSKFRKHQLKCRIYNKSKFKTSRK